MEAAKRRPRIAIACEGGGSHTAFTAGVLKRLLIEPIDIVALSGTSGGAVCATLAWRGLLEGDPDDAIARLEGFWRDNSVDGTEAMWEDWLRFGLRALGEVVSPEVSPYLRWGDAAAELRTLLERHCGFAEMPDLLRRNPAAPRLLIGAADVRSGEFHVFRSHEVPHRGVMYPATEMNAEVIIASAAIPTLFPAVHIDGRDYWDGVFSQNPPVRELPDMVRMMPGNRPPDEIWVVRINPRTCDTVPTSMGEIRDRRNELSGIISLDQELYLIDLLNRLKAGGLSGTKHEHITLRSISVAHEFAELLDYESKLDRSRPFIEALEDHGFGRADEFLRNPDAHIERQSGPPRHAGTPRLSRAK